MTQVAYGQAAVRRALRQAGPTRPRAARVELGKGEAAWHPLSRRRLTFGPARLLYTEYADGTVAIVVRPSEQRVDKPLSATP